MPAGTRIDVDAMGWFHRAVVRNAQDICLEVVNSTAHKNAFICNVQQLLHDDVEVALVIDGRKWPLKRGTDVSRRNARDAAHERAKEAVANKDWKTADKFFQQAVTVPDDFVAWTIQHVISTDRASVVVANYEADAQLAQLKVSLPSMPCALPVLPAFTLTCISLVFALQMSGAIDLVYSAAQDSDFLLYPGMGEIMYDFKHDSSFHVVDLDRDVLGLRVGQYDFTNWERPTLCRIG